MNDRQRRFAEVYVECGNAAEAARRAGYSERTARSIGQRLLTFVDVQNYVRELQEQLADKRIADAREVREFLSDVMRDEDRSINARIRASNTLLRAAGGYMPPVAAEDARAPEDVQGGGPVVYLPWNGRGPFTAWRDHEGKIHLFSQYDDLVIYIDEDELHKIEQWRENRYGSGEEDEC